MNSIIEKEYLLYKWQIKHLVKLAYWELVGGVVLIQELFVMLMYVLLL